MTVVFRYTSLLLLSLCCSSAQAQSQVPVGLFSQGDMSGWKQKNFVGKTDFQLSVHEGKTRLAAHTRRSASGLYKKLTVDLQQTPWLNWSWKSEHCYSGLDERSRDGDDYPVRVYVIYAKGLTLLSAKALNYVWACNQSQGSHWPSAYTARQHMVAVEASNDKLGQWQSYRRNVREDLARYLGEDASEIHGIAVMSDSDNAHGEALAYYGDIWFSSQ